MTNDFFGELFAGNPIMVILRGQSPRDAVALATRAWDAGLTTVEVPVQVPDAISSLAAVVAAGHDRGFGVGAGTVIFRDQVDAVSAAGASFTVAPGLDVSVASASATAGMPHLPGVGSASEIQLAMANGLTYLKAFPASSLGTSWFRAMRGPFPGAHLVATGGIDMGNLEDFLSAGAVAAGLGSVVSDPASIDRLAEYVEGLRLS